MPVTVSVPAVVLVHAPPLLISATFLSVPLAKVKVPTPAGVIDLTIPAGSKAGSQLRLKGRGIPGTTAGDLYAHLQLVLPPVDTEQAKALYRQMEQQLAFNPRAALGV